MLSRKKRALLIAHRGGDFGPENSLENIEGSLERGIEGIEIDLRLTRDEEIVAFHDSRLDYLTKGRGYVAEKSLSELKELELRGGGRIASLAEILELVRARALLKLDLKVPMDPYLSRALEGYGGPVMVCLESGRERAASFKKGVMTEYGSPWIEPGESLQRATELGVDVVCFSHGVDEKLIKRSRKAGVKIDIHITGKPRFVHEPTFLYRIFELRPDYITTDRVVEARELYRGYLKKRKR